MATILVGLTSIGLSSAAAAAGTVLTGGVSVALFAAGLAAAYVDSAFILPSLFGSPKPPPQIGDLQLQTTEPGAPKAITYGALNRLSGQVVWQSDLYSESRSGGGGGKAGESVTLEHFVDVAVGICEREIGEVAEILVDGELIFDADPTYSETGTLDQGTPQIPGKLNIWFLPQTELDTTVFVPLAEGAAINGLNAMDFTRTDLIVSSNPNEPTIGSGVDFAAVRTGKSLKVSGGTFTTPNRTYTVLSVSRGQSPAGGSEGQSVMRLDIRSEGTRTSGINPESYAKNIPNTGITITNATIPAAGGAFANMSITVGAGHGITVTQGEWVHFDLIWRNINNGDDGLTPDQVRGNQGRGLAGGAYWAIATSTTVLDLYDVDKTTRITCATFPIGGSPVFPGNTAGYIINDDTSAVSYSFDQSEAIGPIPTEKWKDGVQDDVEFFVGKANETVLSAIISAREGSDNVPLHNRNAFMVIERLAIGHWGNRIPSFSFIITRTSNETYGDALLDICARVGLGLGRVTAEGTVATEELKGYVIEGIVDAQRAIQPLAIAGDLVSIETGDGTKGILQFFKRLEAPALALDMNLVGARALGDDGFGPVQIDELSDKDLAKQIWLIFQDAENSLQNGVVGFMKNDDVTGTIVATSEKVDTITLPMALDVNQAQGIVQRMFTLANIHRQVLTFTVAPKYLYLRENYRILLILRGQQYWCRVTEATMGVNHLVEVKVVLEDVFDDPGGGQEQEESAAERSQPDFIDATVEIPGPPYQRRNVTPTSSRQLAFEVADLPALTSAHVRRAGVYCTASKYTEIDSTEGYQLHRRRKGHGRFRLITNSTAISPYGFTRGESFGTAVRDLWDMASELVVEISSGEDLVTRTEEEVLEGCNRAFVGSGSSGELIGYVNVTLLRVEYDARIYKLTKFLRGVFDTVITDFSITGRFVPINLGLGALGFDFHSTGDIGTTWEYKAVPTGLTVDDVETDEVFVNGKTIRPRAVAHLKAMVDGSSNDVTISWLRRSRSSFRILSGQTAPLDESFLGFRITIVDESDGTLYRTFEPIEVTPSISPEIREVVYTIDMQSADESTGELVVVTVIQLSDIIEGGFESVVQVQL